MTQEQSHRRQREQRASEELVDSLDSLTTPMAERILGRAIEKDAARAEARRHQEQTFDWEELKRVADEVGISEEALREALLEEFDTDKDRLPTLSERLTIPDEIRGGVVVAKSPRELSALLDEIIARVRTAQTETVPQGDGRNTLVEVKAKTSPLRRRAILLIALFFVLGPALAQLLASVVFLGLAALLVVGVVAAVKGFARRVRRRINRALGSLLDDAGESDSWLEVWERSRRR